MIKNYYKTLFLIFCLLFLARPSLGQAALTYQRLAPLGTTITNPITVNINESSGFAVCTNPPFDFWGLAFTTSATGTVGIGFIQTANDSTHTSDTYTVNLPAGNYFKIYFLCNPTVPLIGQSVDVTGWPYVASDQFTVANAPITQTITATAGSNGSISPSGAVMVNYGANQTFTITPNTGYQVSNVLVDSVSQGAITSFTFTNVTADHTISASFSPVSVGVSSLMGLTGAISLAPTTLGNDFSITTSASTINFNLPSASASTKGLLTSTDWSTFNNKQASLGNLNGLVLGDGTGTYNAITTLNVGFGGTGATTLSGLLKGNGTGPIQTAAGGIDYEFPLIFNSPLSRNMNSISCLTASGSQTGCLSSSDWTTFNGKQNAIIPGTGLNFSGNTLNSVWTSAGSNIYNNNSGNVGIGTAAPGSLLTVTGGDAFISTQSKGVILKATNGSNCFRVTVDNRGRLSTALVTCP